MPAPPEGHPRQCKSNSQVTRRRCRRWALRGSEYCQFHGGRRAAALVFKKGIHKLPSFYSKYLGPTLKERVEELLNAPHDEQVSLYQELAIARSNACEAIKLAQPLFDPKAASKLKEETKALMVQTLAQAMASVKDLVLAASKIEKASKDKVSVKAVNLIVMQIVMAVNDACGTEHLELAEAIRLAIDERVRLPLNDALEPNVEIDLT